MKKKIHIIFFAFLFIFFNTNLKAEEKLCLDEEGFIYPIFGNDNCSNNSKEINKKEFTHLVNFNQSERFLELKNFRETELESKNKDISNIEINTKEKDKKNILKVSEEIKKKAKKIELSSKDNEDILAKIKQRKKEKEDKILARKKEQELKKQQRLADIKKRKEEQEKKKIANKIKQQLKKEKRLADLEKKRREKELKKQQRLAEIENKKIRDAKLRAEKQKAKNKIQNVENVNENLKIIFLNNSIVNQELFPKINPNNDIDFTEIDNLDEQTVNTLFANNSNLVIIIPKDFDTFSSVVSENEVGSTYVAGTKSIPNPEISRIEAELRSAERDYLIAERNFQNSTAAATYYNPYGGWASIFNQMAGLAGQAAAGEKRNNARNRYERWSAKLSSTPHYLEKEVLRNYSYITQGIKAEKKAIFQVIQSKNYSYKEKFISIEKNKNFTAAYNIDPQDKKYNSLVSKYSEKKDITRWQKQKLSNISADKFLNLIENENNFNELPGKNELYVSLNIISTVDDKEEELSWWQKLTSGKKKQNNKSASLNNSSGFELKDERFDSVVIVKTDNGLGSGFFVSKDEILTNYHVIENASTITVTNKANKRSSAVVIKKDLKRDLALLKTNFVGKPVTFFDGQLKQGELVEALGHPKGRKFSLTKGWISAIRMESSVYSVTDTGKVLFIQTDAAINPGNSGGPLFYKDKVVGVNTQGLNKEDTEGMNFAVHFSEAQKFLNK